MNTLQSYYAAVLTDLINAKKKATAKTDDITSILKGMTLLSESSEELDGTGVTTTIAWIPLKYKRMLFMVLYGAAKNTKTVVEMRKGEWCKAVCTLSGTLDGVTYEYTAEATQAYSSTEPFGGLSDDARNSRMIDYALAKAEKLALYNAGICMDFTGDIEEPTTPPGNDKLPEEPVSEDIAKAMQAALASEKAGDKAADSAVVDTNVTDLSDAPKEVKDAIVENDNKLKEKEAAKVDDVEADNSSEDLTVILFGPKTGSDLMGATPKYLAWMLNQMDCGKQKASKNYYETVKALVMGNEQAKKIYEIQSKAKKAS